MLSIKIILLLFIVNQNYELSVLGNAALYKDPHFYPDNIGIVQMFQWPFIAIAKECEDYLGPQGFGAVQVSPIFEHQIIEGRPWYELYQPISYIIQSRLGDEKDFKDMVLRCNKAGVRVYVDTILNHMSRPGKGILKGAAGSTAIPEILYYPAVPYTALDFHLTCKIRDLTDKKQTRRCRLLDLPDLDQSKPNVRQRQTDMLNNLISMGVAGFRIDASTYMDPNDLKEIFSNLNYLPLLHDFDPYSKPFIYHEAHHFKSDYTSLGRVIEFNYESVMANIMRGRYNLKELDNFEFNFDMVDSGSAVVDIDNHDSQRYADFLTFKDPLTLNMGYGFMLAFDYGIPKIISSFAFDEASDSPPANIKGNIFNPSPRADGTCELNWNCEHRYHSVREMLHFAKAVQGESVKNFFNNGNGQFGFCRGDKGFIAFNTGRRDMEIEVDVCLPKGTYCNKISESYQSDICKIKNDKKADDCQGTKIEVNDEHKATIKIPANDPNKFVAFYVTQKF